MPEEGVEQQREEMVIKLQPIGSPCKEHSDF